eukprot:766950-Hanusia_phi.AAC.1
MEIWKAWRKEDRPRSEDLKHTQQMTYQIRRHEAERRAVCVSPALLDAASFATILIALSIVSGFAYATSIQSSHANAGADLRQHPTHRLERVFQGNIMLRGGSSKFLDELPATDNEEEGGVRYEVHGVTEEMKEMYSNGTIPVDQELLNRKKDPNALPKRGNVPDEFQRRFKKCNKSLDPYAGAKDLTS